MRDLLDAALAAAKQAGASYADARWVETRTESIEVKNGKVEAVRSGSDSGFGVRVLCDGAWGFASSSLPPSSKGGQGGAAEAQRVAQLAVRIAKASATTLKESVRLAPVEPKVDSVTPSVAQDPFAVSLERKARLLLEADARMRENPAVRVAEGSMAFVRIRTLFASSEGAFIEQTRTESGAGIMAMGVAGDDMQQRSYPQAHGGDWATRGYEFIEAMDLPGNAARVADELAQLLKAPQREGALILESSQMALQVHESCGHPIELDRVLGMEASFAGTSFMTVDKLGSLRYGSPIVNITADATLEGGLGSLAYDDEGVPGQRVDIVKDGIFVGYLTSRETAPRLAQTSNGTMRADGWNRIPLIRMTNINLLPGDCTLDDLIRGTSDGLYFLTNKSWSIDDRRLNFQFGCEIAYEVKNGALTGTLFKNPTYTGITPQFWNSCDAIAGKGEGEWRLWGVPNCGKGEPMQTARVGHGTAAARFGRVRVGVLEEEDE